MINSIKAKKLGVHWLLGSLCGAQYPKIVSG